MPLKSGLEGDGATPDFQAVMEMFAPVSGQMQMSAVPIDARYATFGAWDSRAVGTCCTVLAA